jgi:hypothetical protein
MGHLQDGSAFFGRQRMRRRRSIPLRPPIPADQAIRRFPALQRADIDPDGVAGRIQPGTRGPRFGNELGFDLAIFQTDHASAPSL